MSVRVRVRMRVRVRAREGNIECKGADVSIGVRVGVRR